MAGLAAALNTINSGHTTMTSLLIRLFGWLLRLYPQSFRDEFAEEMCRVFSEALAEAAGRGIRAVLTLMLHEACDLPNSILSAYLRERRELTMQSPIETEKRSNAMQDIPATPAETLLGTGFFLLYPLGFLLNLVLTNMFGNTILPDSIAMKIISTLLLGIVGGVIAILILAWAKGFPRWSYPYWTVLLILGLALMNATTPGLWILGHTMGSRDFWGWRAWIPMALVLAASMLLTRSWRPLFNGIVDLWHDWTRFSFGFYTFLPFLLFIIYDEVIGEEPFLAVLWCILAIGAFGYMRAKDSLFRILALLTSTVFCLSASIVYLAMYWDGRQEYWMSQPIDGWLNAQSYVSASLNYIALLLSPALLGIARGTVNRLRPA